MSNIAFIPLLFAQVSFSRLPKSYRKLKFYFHTVSTGVFSSCAYWSLYSTRFFSTVILLSSRFAKKITSKIFKFRGDTNGMTLNRKGRWKGFSTRGAKNHKNRHLSKFSQQAPSTAHNIYYIFLVSKIPWKQK